MPTLTAYANSNAADGALTAWTNPTYVYSDDGTNFATREGTVKNTWYGNLFGFDLSSLPDNATLTSITITAEYKNSANDSAGPELFVSSKFNGSVAAGTTDTTGTTSFELVNYTVTGLTIANLKATGANGFWGVLRFRRTDNTAHVASVDYLKCVVVYENILTAAAGSFSLSGQDAVLKAARKIDAGVGAFVLTGKEAGLNRGYRLTAGTGSFSMTGIDAGLRLDRKLSAGTGAFALSGQDADLLYKRMMAAASASFELTGQDAGLLLDRRLDAEPSEFILTGQDAELIYTILEPVIETVGGGSAPFTGLQQRRRPMPVSAEYEDEEIMLLAGSLL